MTDLFGNYQSQSTLGLKRIDSSKYPDTNKDFEANLRRLNGFVDYIGQYLQQMQKGVDDANKDPITQLRDTITNLGVLFGGGELLYGIDLGDLQYYLPALAALFGFDSDQPFPLNLLYAAEHFLLGYIIPLDSWNIAVEDVIDGWLIALGFNSDFIAAIHLILDNLGRFTSDLLGIFNAATGLLGVFNIFDFVNGPIGPIWSAITTLLGSFNIATLGAIANPFLQTLTPWLQALGELLGLVDDFLETFTAGLDTNGTGGLSNVQNWLGDLLGMFGGFTGLGTGSPSITDPSNIPILGPIIAPFINMIGFQNFASLFTHFIPDFSIPGFNPVTAWPTIIGSFLSTAMDWGALALSLFGLGGITNQSGFTGIASNFLQLLGNPDLSPGSFNLISAATQLLQNSLTPAGALSTFTTIPAHIFGSLNQGAAGSNLLQDGSFDNASSINGLSMYFWSADGRLKAGSAWTTGNSVLRQLLGLEIPAIAGDITNLSTYAKWNSLSATAGQAIILAVNSYDADHVLIPDSANRIIASITAPGTNSSSYSGADAGGWVPMVGHYQAPAGTAYLVMALEVSSVVTAGNVGFDDCVQTLQTGMLDASLLKNIGNIPQILAASVDGFSSLPDMIITFQHMLDGLGSAYNPSGAVSGIDFTDLFGLAQTSTTNAVTAAFQSALHQVILGNRTNKSAGLGASPTSQSSVEIAHFSSGGALTTQTVAAGSAIGMRYTVPEFATYGFAEILASIPAGTNHVYLNIFKINPTTNAKTAIFNSADIAATIGTSISTVIRQLLPGIPQSQASDELIFEIVNASASNALTLVTKQTAIPNNTNEVIQNVGWTRSTAAGGNSPTSLTSGQGSYSGTVPFVNVGLVNVPADYHPPVKLDYIGNQSTNVTVPAFLSAGDYFDLIGIGAGGAGQGEQGWNLGQGGRAGAWNYKRLVVGTDIAVGGTVNIAVGAGGPQQITYFAPGVAGDPTVFTWTKPGVGTQTLTCTGGAGGSGSGTRYNGDAAPNAMYDNQSFFGGGSASSGSPGNAPGGGGGGAPPYLFGGAGADGEAHTIGMQA